MLTLYIMFLDDIIDNKRQEIAALKSSLNPRKALKAIAALPRTRDFHSAFPKGKISLIAEVKRASPSAGTIVEDFMPVTLAKLYEKSGAAAVSVLTDKRYFQGDIENLAAIRAATTVPLLRKDFILNEIQVYESRLAGADAILLIVRILTEAELKSFLALARSLNMKALVEVHNEAELERAIKAGAAIIGINQRDLQSFELDPDLTIKLIDQFPELKRKVVVAESGIHSAEQVRALKAKGVSGILVGESLLRSHDIGAKIKELMG